MLLVALYAALGLKGEGWLSVSFVAATAAFLVSLNAFFAWGAAWRVYFHAKGRRALHEAGWTDSLGRLEQVLAETEH